jgi:hypothetical protein
MSRCLNVINFHFHEYGEWIWFPDSKELINRDELESEPFTPAHRDKIKDVEHYFFDIQYIGGAVQYEIEQVGYEDIFKDVMTGIIKEYKEKIKTKKTKIMGLDVEIKSIKPYAAEILTMWEYTSDQDYFGEWDNDFCMIGFVDSLESISVKEDKQ